MSTNVNNKWVHDNIDILYDDTQYLKVKSSLFCDKGKNKHSHINSIGKAGKKKRIFPEELEEKGSTQSQKGIRV